MGVPPWGMRGGPPIPAGLGQASQHQPLQELTPQHRWILYLMPQCASPAVACVQLPPNPPALSAAFSHFSEKCVMNNYFGIGLDAKISLEFNNKRDEHPKKCRLAEPPQIPLEETCTPSHPPLPPPFPPQLSSACTRRDHQDARSHGVGLGVLCLAGDPFLWQVFHLHPVP